MRRPAAHNPMIFRKVAKPAGCKCKVCGAYVREGSDCETCAFNADFAAMFPNEDEKAGK